MSTLTRKRYLSVKFYLAFAIVAAVGLSACQATPPTKLTTDVRIDKTFGNYDDGLESNLVLVTMKLEEYTRLTDSHANSSGSLPSDYVQVLDHLSSKYGITRVADWPLPSINIYCIIFENKGQHTREYLIDSLAHESGVESAHAVNTFAIQTEGPVTGVINVCRAAQELGNADLQVIEILPLCR